jgi:hypothetical protein
MMWRSQKLHVSAFYTVLETRQAPSSMVVRVMSWLGGKCLSKRGFNSREVARSVLPHWSYNVHVCPNNQSWIMSQRGLRWSLMHVARTLQEYYGSGKARQIQEIMTDCQDCIASRQLCFQYLREVSNNVSNLFNRQRIYNPR